MILNLLQNVLSGACITLLLVFAFLKKQKDISYWLWIAMTALAAIVFATDSYILFNGPDPTNDIIRLGTGVLLAPMVWLFCESLTKKDVITPKRVGMVLGVILLFYACLSLIFFFDRPSGISSDFLSKISIYILKSSLVLEIGILVYMSYRCTKLVELPKKCLFFSLIAASTLSILRVLYPVGVWPVAVAIVLNVAITVLIGFAASMVIKYFLAPEVVADNDAKTVTATSNPTEVKNDLPFENVEKGDSDSDSEKDAEAEKQAQEDLEGMASEHGLPQLSEADENSLRYKFENYIIASQKFLTPGLTMGDIAKALDTNRTYISQLVNQTYGMTFPEFLNNLRIDFAEQYILHNREASQQEIAHACGFPSASSFNVTFKKITGVTPKIWLATYDGKDSQ